MVHLPRPTTGGRADGQGARGRDGPKGQRMRDPLFTAGLTAIPRRARGPLPLARMLALLARRSLPLASRWILGRLKLKCEKYEGNRDITSQPNALSLTVRLWRSSEPFKTCLKKHCIFTLYLSKHKMKMKKKGISGMAGQAWVRRATKG